MKRHLALERFKSKLPMALAVGIALMGQNVVWASNFTDFTVDSCTTPNCGAQLVNGPVVIVESSRVVNPFAANVYTAGAECLRLEVLSTSPAGRDLTMHLLGPTLEVWRDDDSGAGLFPRIEAITTAPGRYTLQVSHFGAAAFSNTNTRFTLSIGRYPSSNPNCAEATVPLSSSPGAAAESEK